MKINSRKSRDMHLCNMNTINYAIQTNFHSENKKNNKEIKDRDKTYVNV